MKVPGLRAVHPSKYVFRSSSAKLQSRIRAAFLSPELFDTGVVRAHVFPLRPRSGRSWNGMLAVSFPVPLGESFGEDSTRTFGAALLRGSKVVHRFDRKITLQPHGPEVTSAPTITFLEPVKLDPGSYELRAVMSDPDSDSPHAVKLEVTVPKVPRKELFLTGPILGKAAGVNVVVTGGETGPDLDRVGGVKSFEPLLVQQIDEPVDLVALTEACVYGGGGGQASVQRSLRRADGTVVGDLPVQGIRPEGSGRVRCEQLVDRIPARALADGRYEFEAVLRAPDDDTDGDHGSIRFSVGPGLEETALAE